MALSSARTADRGGLKWDGAMRDTGRARRDAWVHLRVVTDSRIRAIGSGGKQTAGLDLIYAE